MNTLVADRSKVFYWQTDRRITPEDAGNIWADRHQYFSDHEIVERANSLLQGHHLASIEPLDLDAQTNLGNVNSVRVGKLSSGQEVIIRCHPKGIKNGYFHAEALVARQVKEKGLPTYDTLAIYDATNSDDFSFQIIEKLPGFAITKWLEVHSNDEQKLLRQIGKTMAKLHTIKTTAFGPFNNELAKEGTLLGLHSSFSDSVSAGLIFNLEVLIAEKILTDLQASQIQELFTASNTLLEFESPVIVHNDFADWNLLTDGNQVTGILDWDEVVSSHPVSDIACWSTFFEPERMKGFLEGYWELAQRPQNFEEIFELLRLRYVLSKMTLRIRRYSWEKSDSIRKKIEIGKVHLAESINFFGIN